MICELVYRAKLSLEEKDLNEELQLSSGCIRAGAHGLLMLKSPNGSVGVPHC
jgi:hypothetical protein